MKCRLLQTVLVLSLVALCSSALSKHYYIVPVNSTDSACQDYQNGTCLTLEQLAQSNLTSTGGTNLTLSFLHGEHSLTQSLAVHNFTHVQIIGTDKSVVCFHGNSMIEISNSYKLIINYLYLVPKSPTTVVAPLKEEQSSNKQRGLSIITAQSVNIENCHYESIDNQPLDDKYDHNLSAVKISGSRNTTIVNVTFEGNYGNVLTVESHDITILGMNFTGNNGSGVHINSTNTVISDSIFNANTGRVLTIASDSTVMTRCNVSNNVNPHFDCEQSGIITITPHPSVSNNTTTNCSVVPTSYCVRTHDTTLRLCNRKGRCNNQSTNMYHRDFCIDISDMPSTDFGNISSVNDFIFDFTTSSTSNSHGNKGRLCVNTDHQHTLPFTNRVVYCDDKTSIFLVTKSDTHTWEDVDILYSNKMCSSHTKQVLESDACLGVESECMSNTFNRNGANTSSCSDPPSETIDISCVDSHTIGLCDAIVITSCTSTNNTSERGALSIASGCDDHAYCKLDSVLITCCVFTNNTSFQNGGAFSIASRNEGIINVNLGTVIITSSVFSSNVNTVGDGGAFSIASGYKSRINTNLDNILITSCTFTNNTNNSPEDMGADGGVISIASGSEGHLNVTMGNVLVTSCVFKTNMCINGNGGAFYIASGNKEHGNIDLENLLITNCTFYNNSGLNGAGGAVSIGPCFKTFASASLRNVLITACTFTNNGAPCCGGAVSVALAYSVFYANISLNSILISFCTFTGNHAEDYGGAFCLYIWRVNYTSIDIGSVHIVSCTFTNNSCPFQGAALIIAKFGGSSPIGRFNLLCSSIRNTTSNGIYLQGINNATIVHSTFTHSDNIISLFDSTVTFLSRNLFSINSGPVNAFNSKITFEGSTIFSNNSAPISAVQSQLHFNSPEGITITNNTASLGGGIYLRESTMTVSHPIEISQNTADYGGGIYAFLSSIEFISEEVNKQVMITNNNARHSGGGICAIASTIKVSYSFVNINSNTALVNGGGMYIDQSTKIYLLKTNFEIIGRTQYMIRFNSIANSAKYGGGIFIEDSTAEKVYA